MTTLEVIGIVAVVAGVWGHFVVEHLRNPVFYMNRGFLDTISIVKGIVWLSGYALILFGADWVWWVRILEVLVVHMTAPLFSGLFGSIVGVFWKVPLE